MSGSKPSPVVTPETRPFFEGCERRELWIQRCAACNVHYFYPRPACPYCGRTDDVEWVRCSGKATLASYVISHLAGPGFEAPYVIAVVELEEGPRMMSNIAGVEASPEALELDMPLLVDFETRETTSVPVFRPAQS